MDDERRFLRLEGGALDIGWVDADGHHLRSFTAEEVEDGTVEAWWAEQHPGVNRMAMFAEQFTEPVIVGQEVIPLFRPEDVGEVHQFGRVVAGTSIVSVTEWRGPLPRAWRWWRRRRRDAAALRAWEAATAAQYLEGFDEELRGPQGTDHQLKLLEEAAMARHRSTAEPYREDER